MKNFKTALAAILAACALLNLTGCSDNSVSSDDKSKSDASSSGNSAETIKTQYAPITLTDSNTENSIRLFDAITADKDNAMLSPLSLNMALGLLEAGANGETKAQLDSYLQTENYTDFAAEYLEFVRKHRSDEKIYPWQDTPDEVLEIANSLWADNALPLKDDYKQRIGGKFKAEIKNLDFSDPSNALKEINGWVNEKTHEMIPSVLDEISPATAAVLINTVYFESAWYLGEWDIDENKKESYTLSDGTVKELPLMNTSVPAYFENSRATAFGLPYKNGVDFIGILPKESGEFTLESLDIPALLKSEADYYEVTAVMPRLKFDTDFALRDVLCAAGIENVFDVSAADLSGISDMPLYVSEIIQKTSLELDEKGTKAAAVTADFLTGGGPVYKGTKTVRLDRPFAFLIYDKTQDQILFMGKVTEP
ncbi:MAG: serpin family protein [Oscillospiraceae bacterium]|nr:serpin family protein [Oscillospiraceae bacterium]